MFKKLFKIIAMVLMIIALVYLICAALVATGIVGVSSLSFMTLGGVLTLASWSSFLYVALAGMLLAFVISPEGAQAVVERTVEAVKSIGGAVGGIIGGAIGGLSAGLVTGASGSGLFGFIALGVGGYLLYKYVTKPKDPDQQNSTDTRQDAVAVAAT